MSERGDRIEARFIRFPTSESALEVMCNKRVTDAQLDTVGHVFEREFLEAVRIFGNDKFLIEQDVWTGRILRHWHLELSQRTRKFRLIYKIFLERFWVHVQQQVIPNEVQTRRHVRHAGRHHDHRILFGHDDAILPERAIATVRVMPAPPELIAVTHAPIVAEARIARVISIVNVRAGRLVYPGFWQDLPSIPNAFLQVQLAKLGDVFGACIHAETTEADSVRIRFPSRAPNPEWLQQSRLEIREQVLTCDFLNDR